MNVGEGHVFPLSLFFRLSQSEKRGGFETLPSLLHRAAEEGGEKNTKLALIAVITLQLCNSDMFPKLKHIHLYPQTTCILKTAGYGYPVLTCKKYPSHTQVTLFYIRNLMCADGNRGTVSKDVREAVALETQIHGVTP